MGLGSEDEVGEKEIHSSLDLEVKPCIGSEYSM